MDDSQKRYLSEAAIRMPGALSIEETLAPGESKTLVLQIPPDYDFLLERISCPSDGPVLLKIDVAQPPEPSRAASRPTQAFSVALETEYPAHLAALVGEGLEDWTQKNADLTQRAWAGDDPAFFDLIGRDPRVVGSELTVAKVVSWRTELEGFAKSFNLKGSRLFPLTRLEQARAKMEAAKKNLRRLGQVHIAFYDQRGKKPLPPQRRRTRARHDSPRTRTNCHHVGSIGPPRRHLSRRYGTQPFESAPKPRPPVSPQDETCQ